MIRIVRCCLFLVACWSANSFAQSPLELELFEKKIRPALVKNCQSCHNTKLKNGGLDLSTIEGIAHGGESGSLVSKGDPEKSLLLRVTSYDDRLKMPPMGKLPAETLADFAAWMKAGMPMPNAAQVSAVRPPARGRQFTEDEKQFWSFQKLANSAPPEVKQKDWAKSPIDRFVLANLEAKGLRPAPPAQKAALLRRVTFDLTGLPPTEDEIKNFLGDNSADAYGKVVERLLASPRYGEKWGRHWLDIARYADSTGNDEDHRYPYGWRYRDYVIDSFNKDIPYNQFVREQIAGDLLPAPDGSPVNTRGLVATGFLALGPKAIAQQDKKKMLYDIYDEQVDVTTRAMLGITLACARCHDHKFDPLLTKDYYSMISIFASTKNFKNDESHVSEMLYTPLVPASQYETYVKAKERVSDQEREISEYLDQQTRSYVVAQASRIAEYMLAARQIALGKQTAATLSEQSGLEMAMLERWVTYLRPKDEPRGHLTEWERAEPANLQAVAQTYQKRFEVLLPEVYAAIDKSRETRRKRNVPPKEFDEKKDEFFTDVFFRGPFLIPESQLERQLNAKGLDHVTRLRSELTKAKAAVPPEPDMACAVVEGEVVNQKVFVRGDYSSPGEDAPKGFPLIVNGPERPSDIKGSGRLELANWIASPQNPLTPRVIANRVWYWHFGEGIVRTPDNFGKMGERPTHPELLDFLAQRLIDGGWSLKSLHRSILLSNTYQMSSQATESSVAADPENKLFSRFPRKRLSVEEIRDGLLALDGSLDTTMGGTLQSGFGTDGENSNSRLSLKPEDVKRRMVYVPLRRANLPTLLNLFDFGDATTSLGKRPSTTIAPQALFMMNSDFVRERAKNISKLLLEDPSLAPAARVRKLYLRVLNREASAEEVEIAMTYVAGIQQRFEGKLAEPDAWMSLSRILLASNEFIYLD